MRGKSKRNKAEQFAEAIEDTDKILECYRRIQRLLGRFSVSGYQMPMSDILNYSKLNVNISTLRTVDEHAMVRAHDSEKQLTEKINLYI